MHSSASYFFILLDFVNVKHHAVVFQHWQDFFHDFVFSLAPHFAKSFAIGNELLAL